MRASFLKNQLRVGVGVRDVDETSDTWSLSIGVVDTPGLTYWLSR